MKFLAPLLLLALLAGTAHAAPLPPPAPPMKVEHFGGTILGVDAAVLCASYVNGYPFLAHVERRFADNLPAPTVTLAPGGGFLFGLAGRL